MLTFKFHVECSMSWVSIVVFSRNAGQTRIRGHNQHDLAGQRFNLNFTIGWKVHRPMHTVIQ